LRKTGYRIGGGHVVTLKGVEEPPHGWPINIQLNHCAVCARTLEDAPSKHPSYLPDTSFTVDIPDLNDFNSAALVLMLDCVRPGAQANKRCQFSGATTALASTLTMASLEELLAG
jgi:ABC-type transporter Mla MlaB component